MSIASNLFAWISHPTLDTDTDPTDWLLGLLFVCVVAFAWAHILRLID